MHEMQRILKTAYSNINGEINNNKKTTKHSQLSFKKSILKSTAKIPRKDSSLCTKYKNLKAQLKETYR